MSPFTKPSIAVLAQGAPFQDNDITPTAKRITLPRLATIAAVAAVLFIAKDVFLPLAIAMLITFALSPLVTRLRHLGLPLIATVLTVVAATFAAIALFGLVVVGQLGSLAQNLPAFQANIVTKLENLKSSGDGNSIAARLSKMISTINDEIGSALPATAPAQNATVTAAGEVTSQTPSKPIKVEVVESKSAVGMIQDLVLPIVSPLATSGLVIVVVIFMLLEREHLRDRFIRLVGSNDLHRTTQVLEDAGGRVAQYLQIQLLVNVIYAVPIGIGLYLIGVPNAPLWGMLTLVLRFVPYIGSALSAAFPLFLAFAVSPDWSAVIWTAALFVVVELVTSNIVEPWLYGSRTGVSPLAIIVAAIFWTWIWGPLGLVLSTPLTVCLVVLGRHIPQFELFDILFGDEPVLAAHARLYQRLLAGDAMEATFRAEEALEDNFLADYYHSTVIPALLLAQGDRERDVLTSEQEDRLASTALTMVRDLQEIVTEEIEEDEEEAPQPESAAETPSGEGFSIICVGGRNPLDNVSAAMLAQTLEIEGAEATHLTSDDLSPSRFKSLDLVGKDCMILCFLDPSPTKASLLHIRRIKRSAPHIRVGVVIWQMSQEPGAIPDGMIRFGPIAEAKLQEARDLGADFVATDVEAAFAGAFDRSPPVAVQLAVQKARPIIRRRKRATA
jgi:predicted PurR-regulated permease PerM